MQRKLTFITKRTDHILDNSIDEVSNDISPVIEMLKSNDVFAIDTENNHLDPFRATPLLVSIAANQQEVFVIDMTSFDFSFLKGYEDKLFLGHNFQYDYKILKQQGGIELRNCWDTMIVEQILGRGSGRRYSLEATHERRLNRPMEEDKGIRSDFINMGVHSKFTAQHVRYSGYDVFCLFPIKEEQEKFIRQLNLGFRIDIGNKLVPILGDMHLEGFYIDHDKWKKRIQDDKKIRNESAQKLDNIIRDLSKDYPSIRGGKYTRKRQTQEIEQLGLFGGSTTISNDNKGNLNYSSPKQVLEIFKTVDNKYPTTLDKQFNEKASVGEPALEQYKIENPESKLRSFCDYLIEYKTAEKAINSFGEIFLVEYYKVPGKKIRRGFHNPLTGKVHTFYKQEVTANGRLASGEDRQRADKKDTIDSVRNQLGVYNSQQMVKENRFRNCFTLTKEEIDNDIWISTIDLSGAELIILAALANDKKLIELQAKDIHSYLATNAYTKIIKYILSEMRGSRVDQELYDLLKVNKIYNTKAYAKELKNKKGDKIGEMTHKLAGQPLSKEDAHRLTLARVAYAKKHKGYKVNKRHSSDLRDPFKNVVYGSIYGATANKISQTLNIAMFYGEIVLKSMKYDLPMSFGFLDRNADFGVKYGYIIFNKRTNSRHWFKDVLDSRQYGRPLPDSSKGRIQRQCKNLPISGTQADMIKEAMVEIDKYVRENKLDVKFLLQVHDELVFKHKGKEVGKTLAKIMKDTANKYLNGLVEMNAHSDTLHYWNK